MRKHCISKMFKYKHLILLVLTAVAFPFCFFEICPFSSFSSFDKFQDCVIFSISERPLGAAIFVFFVILFLDIFPLGFSRINLKRSIKLSGIAGFTVFTSALAINAILAYLGHTPTVLFVGSGNVYNFLHDTKGDIDEANRIYKGTLKFGWHETTHKSSEDILLIYFLEMGSGIAEQVLTKGYIHQNDYRARKHLPVLALITKKSADYTPVKVIKELPAMGNRNANFFALKLNRHPRSVKACLLSRDKKCEKISDISIDSEFDCDKWAQRILEIKKNNLVFGFEPPDSGSTTKGEVLKVFQKYGYDLRKEDEDGKYKFKCVNDSKCNGDRKHEIISSSPLKAPDLDDDKYAVLFASDFSDDYGCVRENAILSTNEVDYYLVGYVEYPDNKECDKSKCIGYLDAATCSMLNQLLKPEKVIYKGFGTGKTRCSIPVHDQCYASWGNPNKIKELCVKSSNTKDESYLKETEIENK